MNGVNVFAMNLVRGLVELGYDASIVLTDPQRREFIPLERPSDLGFTELAVKTSDSVVQRWKALIRFLNMNRPCVYIPNYDWHTSCVASHLDNQIAIIGIVHSDDPRHYEHFERLGDTWNAVVTVSRAIGDRVSTTEPSISDRLAVIPIGVEASAPQRGSRNNDGHIRLLYAGLLKQFQKRVLDVPEILRETISRGTKVSLTFAGGGDDESTLKEVSREFEAQGIVRFLGILDRERLTEEFDNHDVLLMTSEFEGLPNVLLEAMAHSLVPVVSAVTSGIPEVIRNGENGFIVPIGDISAFADRIQALDHDRTKLSDMASNAFATIQNGPFRADRMVEAYARVIDRVSIEAEEGSFERPRGRIIPPPDLNLSWRHYIPKPVRNLLRRTRGLVRDD